MSEYDSGGEPTRPPYPDCPICGADNHWKANCPNLKRENGFAVVGVNADGDSGFFGMFNSGVIARFVSRHIENPRICEVVWRDDLDEAEEE